jgi:ribonuclease P protein component
MPVERLRRRPDFLAAATGTRARSETFTLQVRQRDDEGPARVGFTVSRKVGNAVERNRARRRLREIVRLSASEAVAPGNDYVVVARRSALTVRFDQLARDFEKAARRLSRKERRRALQDNNAAEPPTGLDEKK